jgi:non-ribosomal peptide synthetase component E (peptide arylation enzyme)
VILVDPRARPAATRIGGRATLDELLRRAALRRPDAVALIDAPNREKVAGGKPRRLTYRQTERVVSAIACRLRRMGLHTDAIVAVQMANTVENVLTLLGVLRAGLIAMPLPLLWRRAEMVAALSRVGASALMVSGRIGSTDHYDLAMHVAAEIFPIRYVCGYGEGAPDGLIAFDDLFAADELDPIPAWVEERAAEPGPGAHLAIITWDVSAEGPVPVARSHSEMIAAGLAAMLESRLQQDATLLSTLVLSSFAGLATALMPWLLVGGTLALHHPFDENVFLAQLATIGCDCMVVPGAVAVQLAEHARSAAVSSPDVIGVWRAPERLSRTLPWRDSKAHMTDVLVFGEAGIVAACRGPGGKPAAVPFGVVPAPRAPNGNIIAAETAATPAGTVAIRGPMVPRAPFPPGAERSGLPYFKVSANGFVDTGFACLPDVGAMLVTGPPPGMVGVGGYRFALADLDSLVNRTEYGDARVQALPDAVMGHRLFGTAGNPAGVVAALFDLGTNPLLISAFRDRSERARA